MENILRYLDSPAWFGPQRAAAVVHGPGPYAPVLRWDLEAAAQKLRDALLPARP